MTCLTRMAALGPLLLPLGRGARCDSRTLIFMPFGRRARKLLVFACDGRAFRTRSDADDWQGVGHYAILEAAMRVLKLEEGVVCQLWRGAGLGFSSFLLYSLP